MMMPTLTPPAPLNCYLQPPASRSASSMDAIKKKYNTHYPSSKLERCKTAPSRHDEVSPSSPSKRPDIPPPYPSIRRRNSGNKLERKPSSASSSSKPPMSPALYATPESTPLPDSPTSPFPAPSPYVVNHKRRGPRLLKSLSTSKKHVERKVDEIDARCYSSHFRRIREENVAGEPKEQRSNEDLAADQMDASSKGGGGDDAIVVQKDDPIRSNGPSPGGHAAGTKAELKILTGRKLGPGSNRDDGESEDFFDPQDSNSYMNNSTDGKDYGSGDLTAKAYTPMAEYYDAWEELSSESGRQARRSLFNAELDLREMRLSMLMEMEKRKQAEETLSSMQSQWQTLRDKLATAGLNLPVDLSSLSEDNHNQSRSTDPMEDICRQVRVSRFVSESLGKAAAKAEAEVEMKAQLEVKNFEITRLTDRLHYYETMNREMSQRNQEAIEITRRERQMKKRRQEWIWGSIGAAITLGSVALVWSFIPGGKGFSVTNFLVANHSDDLPSSNPNYHQGGNVFTLCA